MALATSRPLSFARRVTRIPGPEEKVERWHVSPLVDLSAYALSWLWVLAPLLAFGPAREDYLLLYLATIALTDLHRHFGLPYVYLDSQVRRRYPARFWLFPACMLLCVALSPWLDDSAIVLSTADLCAGVALLIVLLQVLRRDGGPSAIPARELSAVLGTSLGLAALLHLGARAWLPAIDPAWAWFGAALFAATWFDWQRLRQRNDSTSPAGEAAEPRARRFTASLLVVALLGFALLAGPWLEAHQPEGGLPITYVLAAVGAFAALWNFWHVYMQKYGIMRMYAAKALAARSPAERSRPELPGWNDRFLVICWLPLYFAYLGPLYREIAVDYFDDASAVLPGFIDLLERAMPVTIPLTIAVVVVAHLLWLRAEWRAHGLRNVPRLCMAAGTSTLALCFFVFDPVKVYLAFAFSHALEYCVFVWAFQRKRYNVQLEHRPLLGRLLAHPVVFYVGMVLLFGVAILLLKYWGRFIMPDASRPELLGYRVSYWLGFWGVYQSMVHFYFDGFLWKMRLPSVRANL